jgi:hypothetical protein
MPRCKDLGPLAKSCHWLADTLMLAVSSAGGASTRTFLDLERRLALAVEAYGEMVRGGDLARVEVLLRELETPDWSSRRSSGGYEYYDAMYMRENSRYCRRRLVALRKRLERITAAGASARETRDLRREVEAFERVFEDEAP